MNSKNKILIAISITIVIILLLSLAIISIDKKENNITNNEIVNENVIVNNIANEEVYYNEIETNQIIDNEEYNGVEYLTDEREYFSIKGIIEKYLELMGNNEKETLIKLISPSYLEEFNINKDNIKYNIPERENYTQFYYLDIENMLKADISNRTKLYFITANVSIKYTSDKYPLNIMIETDRVNLTYNIYPEDYLVKYKLNNLKVGDTIKFNESEILIRDNLNKYTYVKSITDKEMANKLFNDYMYKLKVDSTSAYEKLNLEYSKKRFGSKENFETYLEDNKKIIALMEISKYKIISNDNYTDYICSDKYDNIYIFRQQEEIMRYTVFLDDYTVMMDEDIEDYNKLDKLDKAKYNLNKFIKMVNTKDYNAIYNVLDVTFKNNNFTNVEKLKEYLKTNMYDINVIELEDYDDKTYEYYIFNCIITNKRNESETKNMTIILDQGEETDFTMSFSFN